jgi:hypothetical protein
MKKRPPKKLSPKVLRAKAIPDPSVLPSVSVTVGGPEKLSYAYLRQIAQYLYTTSLQKMSLADLAEHPTFKGHVDVKTLGFWSGKDGWVEQRRQNAEAWRQQLTAETGRELVEFRREQLGKLRQLAGVMFDKLLPDKKGKLKIEAGSYEAMATAFVRVMSLGVDLTEKSIDDIMPDVKPVTDGEATEKSKVALQSSLTIEEARIGAKAILAERRAQMRAQLAAHVPTPVAPDPNKVQ